VILILLLDNFDSFTYNLVDYLKQLHVNALIFRNNIQIEEITKHTFNGVVLSPGPGKPGDAGNMMELIEYYEDKIPILGICLGHQAIGSYFNAKIITADKPMHGKISKIKLADDYLFNQIPDEINVVRYHSLVLHHLPVELEIIATTDHGEVMAIRHKYKNIRGLQFHPEAVLTESGMNILRNWVEHNEI